MSPQFSSGVCPFAREMAGAAGVGGSGAGIEGEMKLSVQQLEEPVPGGPIIGGGGEMHGQRAGVDPTGLQG